MFRDEWKVCSGHFKLPVKNKPMTKQELIKQVEELEKQVAELKEGAESMQEKEGCAWRPEHLEEYFSTNLRGDVVERMNISQEVTDKDLSFGNCFKTREEAKQFAEWLRARAVLVEDAKIANGDWIPSYEEDDKGWYGNKFTVYYDYDDDVLLVSCETYTKASEIVFKLEESAEQSIADHEEEWATYLGVQDHD